MQFWPEYPVMKEGANRNRDGDKTEASSTFQEKLKTLLEKGKNITEQPSSPR